MMKFSCFESTVEALYAHVVPVPKEQCSKATQLGVSFAAGYIAGVLCAIVSHPADNLVSYLNNQKGASIGQVKWDAHEKYKIIFVVFQNYQVFCLWSSGMLCKRLFVQSVSDYRG